MTIARRKLAPARPHQFKIRLSSDERAIVADLAMAAGMSSADVVRQLIRREYERNARRVA